MKICPTCETKYSDSLEYCMQDGTVLSVLPDPNATLRLENRPSRPTHPTNTDTQRRFTFGAIAVAGLFLLILLVVIVVSIGYLSWSSRDTNQSNRAADPSLSTANNRNTE